ncbi:hypothetical protein ACP4OV_009721 [Aristida adscensionis]
MPDACVPAEAQVAMPDASVQAEVPVAMPDAAYCNQESVSELRLIIWEGFLPCRGKGRRVLELILEDQEFRWRLGAPPSPLTSTTIAPWTCTPSSFRTLRTKAPTTCTPSSSLTPRTKAPTTCTPSSSPTLRNRW